MRFGFDVKQYSVMSMFAFYIDINHIIYLFILYICTGVYTYFIYILNMYLCIYIHEMTCIYIYEMTLMGTSEEQNMGIILL